MEKPYDEIRNLPGAQGDDEPGDGVRKHLRHPGAAGNQGHDVRSILLHKWLACCSILVHSKQSLWRTNLIGAGIVGGLR